MLGATGLLLLALGTFGAASGALRAARSEIAVRQALGARPVQAVGAPLVQLGRALAIEANLAHAVKDSNGRSYNRTQYLTKRFDQVQQWADYLDKLKAGAEVIPLRGSAA